MKQDNQISPEQHSVTYLNLLSNQATAFESNEARKALSTAQNHISEILKAWYLAVDRSQFDAISTHCEALLQFFLSTGNLKNSLPPFRYALDKLRIHIKQLESPPLLPTLTLIKLLLAQAELLDELGSYTESLVLYEEAFSLAEEIGDHESQMWASLLLSSHQNKNGNFIAARLRAEKALYLARITGYLLGEAESHINLGWTALKQNITTRAEKHFQEALNIFIKSNNLDGRVKSLLGQAEISRNSGDLSHAIFLSRNALELAISNGNQLMEALALRSLGQSFVKLGERDEAINVLTKALDLSIKKGTRAELAKNRLLLGKAAYARSDYGQAREQYRQSLAMAMTIENRLLEGEILHEMGHLLCDLGELDAAEETFRKAMRLHLEMDDSKRAVENLPGLARVALLNGDLGNAKDRTTAFLRFMKSSALEGLNDPCLAYLICGQVLLANKDPAAGKILSKAQATIQEYAARIKDEKIRKSFLQNNTCQQKFQNSHTNPFDHTGNSILEESNGKL
jgi:tetratricopeptide (TPR) repeat protein